MTQATFCNVLEHPFIIQRPVQRKLTDFLKFFALPGILEIFTCIRGKPTQQNGKNFLKSREGQLHRSVLSHIMQMEKEVPFVTQC